jgi:hypothetical protein
MLGYRSVEELENEMSRDEYLDWLAYLNIKMSHHEKLEYYLADIKSILVTHWGKKKVELKDCLLEFNVSEEKKPATKETALERARRMIAGDVGVNPVVVKMNQWKSLHLATRKKK